MSGQAIFKSIAIAATIVAGIISGGIGIDMLYKETPTPITIGPVPFPAGVALLIIGLVLILAALNAFSKTNPRQNPATPQVGKNWLILLGILIAIVLLGVFFALHFDPKQPLDKYNLLVNLILIIIGITAAVGYGIYLWIWQNIRHRVERIADEIRKVANDDRNIIKAEVSTSLGYVWFQHHELGIRHERGANADNKPPDYIALAIGFAESALKDANKLNEKEHEELICRCKSNLAYYLTERHRMEEHPQDKKRALELAQYAYQVAKEERALEYVRPYNWEETYAWVLWHFAKDDKTKQKAHKMIYGFLERTDIPDDWSERIEKKWTALKTDNA